MVVVVVVVMVVVVVVGVAARSGGCCKHVSARSWSPVIGRLVSHWHVEPRTPPFALHALPNLQMVLTAARSDSDAEDWSRL